MANQAATSVTAVATAMATSCGGLPWVEPTSRMTLVIVPGPAIMGIASGNADIIACARFAGLARRLARARLAAKEHINRHQKEQHAARDAEGFRCDAERGEDRLPRQPKDQDDDRGDDDGARDDGSAFLWRQPRRQRQHHRHQPNWVYYGEHRHERFDDKLHASIVSHTLSAASAGYAVCRCR